MNIYPAIDLKENKCVRLYQGNYNQVTIYDHNPIELAKKFATQGAKHLHIVDLDGAKQGQPVHQDLIIRIGKASGLLIQTGGGLRTNQQITELRNQGIHRVILGSIAIKKFEKVKDWIKEFGAEHIVLAFDVRLDKMNNPKLALEGWQTASEKSLWHILDEYQEFAPHVLCTDIQRDGTFLGPNISLYKECVVRYPMISFQASGGISQLDDLSHLANIPVKSTIIGKALYENKFSLSEALKEIPLC